MSKGKKAKTLRRSTQQAVLEPRQRTATGSGGVRAQAQQECWDFRIVETTPLSAQALTGMPLSGLILRHRVAVNASFGLIGFVPQRIALKMIEVQEISGGTLTGAVISSGSIRIPPSVRICVG